MSSVVAYAFLLSPLPVTWSDYLPGTCRWIHRIKSKTLFYSPILPKCSVNTSRFLKVTFFQTTLAFNTLPTHTSQCFLLCKHVSYKTTYMELLVSPYFASTEQLCASSCNPTSLNHVSHWFLIICRHTIKFCEKAPPTSSYPHSLHLV